MLVDDLLRVAAEKAPDQPAVIGSSRTLTFAELDAEATAFASALVEQIGSEGSIVALTSLLEPEFAVAYYGVIRSGNVSLPVNPLLREDGLNHILTASAARLHFKLDEPLPRSDKPLPARESSVDDVACVQFTSGTTALPKGVRLTHANLTTNAAQIAQAHELGPDSVTVNHLPTYHLMHLNSAVHAGATQVLCTDTDLAASIELANERRATHYYSLPVKLGRLAADPRLSELKLDTVRVIASGGSALPPRSATTLGEHFGIPVIQGYGLAETSPLTHSDGPSHPKIGSVGPVVEGTECRIVGIESREVLGTGEQGEVQLRGPQLMKGYLDTDLSEVTEDGWLSTGDVGYVDEDGYLFLVDRIKDVFKHDNWLVSPTEIERVLEGHPAVAECVVMDQPDELSGAVAAAFVVAKPGWTGKSQEFVEYVNERVPYFKRLVHAVVLPGIPRSANGKIQRRDLRARMLQWRSADVVTFITKFTVKGDPAEFERVFKEHSEFMKAQPGFVGFQMVRSLRTPTVYVNIGQWADADAHRAVVSNPEFQEHAKAMRELVEVEADLYSPIAGA
ncbi:4-coumarate--CoA ligase family protein [Kutzneria viridogrisea]|uniref:ABM domain-containing protein n=2 Tax=Kutzneria TaxID=43356 RepID=W5WKA7_9PSEU|nr:AMP-binding protein [Kutzneria albida]AHI01181.1 hypothetical protein KALB_7823 [Kutzneria albida DSM 43870]MBA8926434.1 long-chain acyl-CoA synthetase [Kutzneria viridogrisea]